MKPGRYPKFQNAGNLELGTGHAKEANQRLFLNPTINTTKLFTQELDVDKRGYYSLHLIYETIRKPEVEELPEPEKPLPVLTRKGKSKGGKGKGKGLVAKKVKTEPVNECSSPSVSLYIFNYKGYRSNYIL
jgi:hypothetical protein